MIEQRLKANTHFGRNERVHVAALSVYIGPSHT